MMNKHLGDGPQDPARRFAACLRGWFDDTPFTAGAAMKKEKTSRSSVYGWIKELRAADWVEQVEAQHGKKAAMYRVAPEDLNKDKTGVLPPPEQVFGCAT
jgi:hypothetical protein